MSEPLIYAIVLNYNGYRDALECLETLKKVAYPNLRILAVDNGSTDGSAAIIAKEFPEIELLAITPNRGFAGGMNAGIRHALASGAGLVFTTNNDTWIAPDSLKELTRYCEPGVGALAPLIYYAGSPEIIWSSGSRINRLIIEKRDRLMNQTRPGDLPEYIERDFVSCTVLYTRQALEEVGIFDEGFHLYYEDSDLCFRLRQAGYKIRLVPAASAWHKVAASSGGTNTPGERYWMARSSIRFYRKHARFWQLPLVVAWRTLSALRTSLRLLWARKPAALKAHWKGLADGLNDLRKPA